MHGEAGSRHGAQLYRLLLRAGARLLPLPEVVDVEEVPVCEASEGACQGRTERGEPGTFGGASERLEGYPARHGPLQGTSLCRLSALEPRRRPCTVGGWFGPRSARCARRRGRVL